MALVLTYTPKVKEALKAPIAAGIELLVLGCVAAAVGMMVMLARHAGQPFTEKVEISLSLWSLPKYTMLSLARGFAAYGLSLVFTLIYGTIAAHNHRAERVMIPLLDVLQAIPVLGFLPSLVLALVSLFPSRELGLELACIIMIFTAQVWNMTFSFHGSLRGIPSALREVSAIQRLSGWQIFSLLEVPASMIGLVWNSMMSMAGGWFFLTVNEAFQLGSDANGRPRDYRLPGIGSYMSEAIAQHNKIAMLGAIVAMIIMIVVVDQVFWRPIVVWSQRFKLEDSSAADAPQSWVVNLFRRSRLLKLLEKLFSHRRAEPVAAAPASAAPASRLEYGRAPAQSETRKLLIRIANWSIVVVLAFIALWGAWGLAKLLIQLPVYSGSISGENWLSVLLALLASFLRTTAAVLIGAAWALPAGILIGLSPKWSQRLQPIVQVLASFPAPMLFPFVIALLVTLFHIPFGLACVSLMLLGSQWYILFNVMAGASAIPSELKEAATVYRMTRAQRWQRLYLPCTFPYLVTGLITAAGGAWNATIVSEYFQSGDTTMKTFGLGSIISDATSNANFPLLAASVITMALFVVLLNRIVWKRLYRLAESRYSMNV